MKYVSKVASGASFLRVKKKPNHHPMSTILIPPVDLYLLVSIAEVSSFLTANFHELLTSAPSAAGYGKRLFRSTNIGARAP